MIKEISEFESCSRPTMHLIKHPVTITAIFLFCLLIGPFSTQDNASAPQQQDPLKNRAASINKYVLPYVQSKNFSGVILVAHGNEILFEQAYGMSDFKAGVSNTPNTKFQIASISKSFTAAAILLLQEREQLKLDDPVNRFLGDFPNGNAITIHHLLSHTSGLPRNVFFADYHDQSQRHHTVQDLVRWFRDKPLAFPPGSRYGYSNSNFILLADVIEKISGKTYGDFLQTNIISPLGLAKTGHRGSMEQNVENLAKGWNPKGETELGPSDYFDYSFATGSGSLYSTARDLLKWFNASAQGDFLSEGSKALMIGGPDSDGYAFHSDKQLGRDVYYATGWDGVGFSARLIHFKNEKLTIIVLCNLNMNNVTSEIQQTVSKLMLGERPKQLRLRHSQRFPADVGGSYSFGDDFFVPHAKMKILVVHQHLVVDDGRPGDDFGALLQTVEGDFIHRQHWFRINFITKEGRTSSMKYDSFTATKDP